MEKDNNMEQDRVKNEHFFEEETEGKNDSEEVGTKAVEEIDANNEEAFDWKKEILSWVKIFIVAILAATILDNFIIINANVPSGSMENTIMTGDRMIGNRLAYKFGEPKRGDVVIFKFPDDEEQNFVKRVIGLPGDKVTITDAKVYINDSATPLEEDYLPDEWVTMNDGLTYEVPQDSYFVMGDNRNISNDARYWHNTYVNKDAIIAKAVVVYWPFSDAGWIESAEYSIDE